MHAMSMAHLYVENDRSQINFSLNLHCILALTANSHTHMFSVCEMITRFEHTHVHSVACTALSRKTLW